MTQENDLPRISAPARRALQSAGITSLKQLTQTSEAEVLQLHGMGPNALGKLREALEAHGLAFRESTPKKGKGDPVDTTIQARIDLIFTGDGESRFEAYTSLMRETERPVDWAYQVWDQLLEGLAHKDNHVRAICGQLLGNLGKSDPKGRMFKDFDQLLEVTRDERFVTARHTLQNIWKVGLGGRSAQALVLNGLEKRYKECVREKNGALIRYDILAALRNLYDATASGEIKEKALKLIELEKDVKYRRKYAGVWRK